MAKYVFKSSVLHSGQQFSIGDLCPAEHVDAFLKLGVLSEVYQPKESAPKAEAPKAKKE